MEPRESDGKYIIRNIEEDTEITIEGIIKDDPTGNATIEGETKVQANGSTLPESGNHQRLYAFRTSVRATGCIRRKYADTFE